MEIVIGKTGFLIAGLPWFVTKKIDRFRCPFFSLHYEITRFDKKAKLTESEEYFVERLSSGMGLENFPLIKQTL